MSSPPEPGLGDLVVRYDRQGKAARIDAKLFIVTFQEGSSWVGYCRELDVSSCAATEPEALEATKHAIHLFFTSCIDRGVLEEALTELGFRVTRTSGMVMNAEMMSVPAPPRMPAIIAKQMEAGNRWPYQYELAS